MPRTYVSRGVCAENESHRNQEYALPRIPQIVNRMGEIMAQLDNSSVLITGGTGSLGKALINFLMENTKARRIAIYSRDELKQHNLRNQIGEDERLRWFIGDIRDLERLKRALHGVDFVIHAAALKQVDTGEYNPMEFIKTNVLGSQNVIDAAIEAGVKRVVALSTDKASSPINLYGATKLTSDKLFVAANNYSFSYGTTFSVVRYGNVMGSRGSVIPFWKSLADAGKPLPITDLRMTRFWISIEQAVKFVMDSLEFMEGGELYVPRIPSMKIVDLAAAVAPGAVIEQIGMRPGEKLHEEMISSDDSRRTFLNGDRYVVTPVVAEWGYQIPKGYPVAEGVAYQSHTNDLWMSTSDIKEFLNEIH
jgi:UDP-N-acetylglucosamine 4,6-dehydratase/5-epimerase